MRRAVAVAALALVLALGAGCSAGNRTTQDNSVIPRPDGSSGPTVVLPGDPGAVGPNGPGR